MGQKEEACRKQGEHNMNMQFIYYLKTLPYGKLRLAWWIKTITKKYRRHAFLSARPSFSGTMWWMATNTSTGVKAGPIWAEPWHEQIWTINVCWLEVGEEKRNTNVFF